MSFSKIPQNTERVLKVLTGVTDPELRWALVALLNHELGNKTFLLYELEEFDKAINEAGVRAYFIIQEGDMKANGMSLTQIRKLVISIRFGVGEYSQPGILQLMLALEIAEHANRMIKQARSAIDAELE